MRVGVDGRSLASGSARGVAHYTRALLGALAAAFPQDELRVLLPRDAPDPLAEGGSAGAAPRDAPDPIAEGGSVRAVPPDASGALAEGGSVRAVPPDASGALAEGGSARAAPPDASGALAAGGGPVRLVRAPLPGRVLHGAAAVARVPRLEWLLGGVDVVWLPAPAPVAIGRRTPFVLTVHDRSWEVRPGDFTPYERLWHVAARPRALARAASRVLCVSEAVRREVVAAWSLDPARVIATPLAPAAGVEAPPPGAAGVAARQPGAAALTGSERPYFLFVGALEPRKGPDLLAAAFSRARAAGLDADLVVVGSGRLAPALAGDGIRRLGRVADAQLAALYAGALALVAPSRLEGFGLPPVEAAAHGVPAILTDLAPWRETLGGAARFAPPDERALAAAMLELARDPAARARLGAAARRRAGALSWAQTARATRAALAAAASAGA